MAIQMPIGSLIYITGVYGPPQLKDRHIIWRFLTEISSNMQNPWLILGDFNQVQTEAEKFSKNSKLEGAYVLQSALFQASLMDIHSLEIGSLGPITRMIMNL